MTSSVTERANRFVADRLSQAQGLGRTLAELVDEPDAFVEVLTGGFTELADPGYAAEQERVAPGGTRVIGVRWPLIRAAARAVGAALRASSSSTAISLAQRLSREELREVRLFSHVALAVSLDDDPERSWQVIRRLARVATDWICVDDLAALTARGIVNEEFRWAELEQLIYSTHPLERRLVGSTLARLPTALPPHQRSRLPAARGLELLAALIGDADQQVQKALGWALRSWAQVDQPLVAAFLEHETERVVADQDGNRAWVIRDGLSAQPAAVADRLRGRLAGIRRGPAAPDTSEAHRTAVSFGRAEVAAAADHAAFLRQGERMERRGVA